MPSRKLKLRTQTIPRNAVRGFAVWGLLFAVAAAVAVRLRSFHAKLSTAIKTATATKTESTNRKEFLF